jgi:hypothetical protein
MLTEQQLLIAYWFPLRAPLRANRETWTSRDAKLITNPWPARRDAVGVFYCIISMLTPATRGYFRVAGGQIVDGKHQQFEPPANCYRRLIVGL